VKGLSYKCLNADKELKDILKGDGLLVDHQASDCDFSDDKTKIN